MWHWILDAVGAAIIWSLGRITGWEAGWNHGYRASWADDTKAKQRTKE